ncbi:MAG: hypothetical protein U5L45_04400 [Saprospiraceae bacterium]|nr:hypothetical protein [Saprospiraceae bacterium]
MKKIILIMTLFSAFILRGSSQTRDKIITKNFKFENGIYATFADWQRNKPTYQWDSIETTFAVNPTTFLMQMEALRVKKTAKLVDIDSVWGVVVDGIPYMRLPKKEISKPTACFAGFVLRGSICYFQYETLVQTKVPITAYIPETGEAFMTRNVSNKTPIVKEKLMRYETGEIMDLTLNNFKQLIADDKDLLTTVNELKPNEIKEKLFKCILIYNDRNPVFLK